MSLALSALVLLLLVLPGFLVVQGVLGRLGRKPVDPIGQPGINWLWIAGLLIAAALTCFLASKRSSTPWICLLCAGLDSGDAGDF